MSGENEWPFLMANEESLGEQEFKSRYVDSGFVRMGYGPSESGGKDFFLASEGSWTVVRARGCLNPARFDESPPSKPVRATDHGGEPGYLRKVKYLFNAPRICRFQRVQKTILKPNQAGSLADRAARNMWAIGVGTAAGHALAGLIQKESDTTARPDMDHELANQFLLACLTSGHSTLRGVAHVTATAVLQSTNAGGSSIQGSSQKVTSFANRWLKEYTDTSKKSVNPWQQWARIRTDFRWLTEISDDPEEFLNASLEWISQKTSNTPSGRIQVEDTIRDIMLERPLSTSELTYTGSPMVSMTLQHTVMQSKNVVLEGVPGTGKTFAIKDEICREWDKERVLAGEGREAYAITLHPATTYEDFVEGLRPTAPPSFKKGVSENAGDEPSVPFDAENPGPRKANPAHPETTMQPSETRDTAKWAKWVKSVSKKDQVDGIVSRSAFSNYFHVWNPTIHGSPSSGASTFRMQDGFFLRVCAEAVNNPKNDYVVLLDEINRCNVPKVMGDLLTTIERSKRAKWVESGDGYWDLSKCQVVTLPGSKRLFFVPDNVYVVATMNTTDRSVAPLDAALRRRFAFVRLWPKGFDPSNKSKEPYEVWKDEFKKDNDSSIAKIWNNGKAKAEFEVSLKAWIALNRNLRKIGPDAMLGHSYLFDLAEDMLDKNGTPKKSRELKAAVRHHWNFHILPQLIDMAVSNNVEVGLVTPTKGNNSSESNLGTLTKDLFQGDEFTLTGELPAASGLLQVPSLRLY